MIFVKFIVTSSSHGFDLMGVPRSVYRINGLDTVPLNHYEALTRPDSDGVTSSSRGFDLMGVSRSEY